MPCASKKDEKSEKKGEKRRSVGTGSLHPRMYPGRFLKILLCYQRLVRLALIHNYEEGKSPGSR
jgi:hypothetical protein